MATRLTKDQMEENSARGGRAVSAFRAFWDGLGFDLVPRGPALEFRAHVTYSCDSYESIVQHADIRIQTIAMQANTVDIFEEDLFDEELYLQFVPAYCKFKFLRKSGALIISQDDSPRIGSYEVRIVVSGESTQI